MNELAFDFGNSWGKWYAPGKREYGNFRHAIAPLTESQWNAVVGRNPNPPVGYIRVNGLPYAIGDAARRHQIKERPRGAARYVESYYGVALGNALASAFKRSMRNILLFASHPPGDADYVRDLVAVSTNRWEVISSDGAFIFDVRLTWNFDEPLGGYSHYSFTANGTPRKNNVLEDMTTLVIDVGGLTTDVFAIDPGGEIDQLSGRSTRTGVIHLTERFERELRSANRKQFQETGDIDIRRLERAILSGVYTFGKVRIDCAEIARAAIMELVNDIGQVIAQAGGAANFDHMLLTGGGSALIYQALEDTFPRINFLLADDNLDNLQYANVFGGSKMMRLLQRMGEL